MKSNAKKILSLVLMLIMVLSTAAPAYASPYQLTRHFGIVRHDSITADTDQSFDRIFVLGTERENADIGIVRTVNGRAAPCIRIEQNLLCIHEVRRRTHICGIDPRTYHIVIADRRNTRRRVVRLQGIQRFVCCRNKQNAIRFWIASHQIKHIKGDFYHV